MVCMRFPVKLKTITFSVLFETMHNYTHISSNSLDAKTDARLLFWQFYFKEKITFSFFLLSVDVFK